MGALHTRMGQSIGGRSQDGLLAGIIDLLPGLICILIGHQACSQLLALGFRLAFGET